MTRQFLHAATFSKSGVTKEAVKEILEGRKRVHKKDSTRTFEDDSSFWKKEILLDIKDYQKMLGKSKKTKKAKEQFADTLNQKVIRLVNLARMLSRFEDLNTFIDLMIEKNLDFEVFANQHKFENSGKGWAEFSNKTETNLKDVIKEQEKSLNQIAGNKKELDEIKERLSDLRGQGNKLEFSEKIVELFSKQE
jgi:hypothetical protein